jgi:hypothetical protein
MGRGIKKKKTTYFGYKSLFTHTQAKLRKDEYKYFFSHWTFFPLDLFAFGLSAKLMPRALELLFPHPKILKMQKLLNSNMNKCVCNCEKREKRDCDTM